MKLVHLAAVAMTAIAFGRSSAQQAPQADDPRDAATESILAAQQDLIVKTVSLHHLTAPEAVQLLTPYVRSSGGGVFAAPSRAVTIRESRKNLNDILRVLAQYDRDPANVTLNFQLIAAENTTTRDPNLVGLDSLLRGVLKYTGYRLLTTAVASGSEFGQVTQTLSGDGEPFTLAVDISEVRTGPNTNDSNIHLHVVLIRDAVPGAVGVGHNSSQILSTGLTVPIGQTVVLGTSAVDGGQRALILTVRPQLVAVKK